MKRARKGFTLIEVICVLTIIAIIAAVAIPNIAGYIDRSKINNCRSIMTNFANDLEYRIVSKRFYDINELDEDLVKVVDSYSGTKHTPSLSENDRAGGIKYYKEEITSITGICPNGGNYSVEWEITPVTGDESDVRSARVDVKKCECDCMAGEDKVTVPTHEFNAALINNSMRDNNLSREELLKLDTENIIQVITGSYEHSNPSDTVKKVVDEFTYAGYEVAGITMNSSGVEWISVYFPHEADEINNVESFTFATLSVPDDRFYITELDADQYRDINNWPPAEGTNGSAVFKEGWNTDVLYKAGELGKKYNDANNSPVNVEWIQRDGQWYVQKIDGNGLVKGIDFTVPVQGETSDEEYLKTVDSLPLAGVKKLVDNDEDVKTDRSGDESVKVPPVVLQNRDGVSFDNLEDAFELEVFYLRNGSDKVALNGREGDAFELFGHIKVSENSNTIKNGYLIARDESEFADKTWAGVFSDSDRQDEDSDTLSELLENESDIISEIKSGERDKFVLVYQEYYKYYDKEEGKFVLEPVTCWQEVNVSVTFPETDLNASIDDNGNISVENTVNIQSGEESFSFPGYINKPMFAEDEKDDFFTYGSGQDDRDMLLHTAVSDLDVKIEVSEGTYVSIGTVSSESQGFRTDYNQTATDNDKTLFKISDVKVYSTNKYTFKNLKGDITETQIIKKEIPHTSGDDDKAVSFYIGKYQGYSNSEEKNLTDSFNDYGGNIGVFLRNMPSGGNTQIFQYSSTPVSVFHADNPVYNMSYNNKDELKVTDFDIDYSNTVTVDCEAIRWAFPNNEASGSGKISFKLPHKEKDGGCGYYIAATEKTVYKSDASNRNSYKDNVEAPLVKKLNEFESSGYVLVQTVDNGITKLFEINTTLKSLDANYNDSTGSAKFSTGNITAKVYYNIDIKNVKNGLNKIISREYLLNYSSSGDRNYYLSKKDESVSDFNKIKDNTPSVVQCLQLANSQTVNGIKFLGITLWGSRNPYYQFKDDLLVLYRDKESNKVVTNTVYVDLVSGVSISDYIYFKTGSSDKVYLAAYRGNNYNLFIPSTVTGYWTDSVAGLGSNVRTAEIQYKGESLYYVADGNEYSIERIGRPFEETEQVNASDYAVDFLNDGYVLQSITLDSEIQTIGAYAFAGQKNLYSVSLPSGGLTTIEQHAFDGVKVSGPQFDIPSSVTSIGKDAFRDFEIADGTLMIEGSSSEDAKYGKTIDSGIFDGAKFKSLSFGSEVGKINTSAFSGNESSASVSLGSVKYIGNEAFSGCTKFTGNLTIPESVEYVGYEAFDSYAAALNPANDRIPSLSILSGTTSDKTVLGGLIFTNAQFNGVEIGGNVTTIGNYAFRNSPFKSKNPYNKIKGTLTLGDSITTIGNYAFEDCTGLTGGLTVPDRVTSIGDAAFLGCCNFRGNLKLPADLESIGSRAFMECHGFTGKLELNKTKVKRIGMQAFKNCMRFTGGLTVPETVTDGIGYCAFENFASKTDNTSDGNDTGTLEIRAGSHSDGKKLGAFIFSGAKFNNIIIGGIVEEVEAYAFKNGSSIKDKDENPDYEGMYPDDMINHTPESEHEKQDMSRDTYDIKEYEYEESIESGQTVIADYSKITGSLTIESGVDAIGNYAFYHFNSLDGRVLFKTEKVNNAENGVERIGIGAFCGCTGLYKDAKLTEQERNLTIPSTVRYIGRCAFKSFGDKKTAKSLTILGGSSGNILGKWDKDASGKNEVDHPVFPDSRFVNVTIGGSVKEIAAGFLDNKMLELYNSDLKKLLDDGKITQAEHDSQKAINDSTYDYSGITGTLSFTGDCQINIISENAFRGAQFSGNLELPDSLTIIKYEAFSECKNFTGTLNVKGATAVGDKAFYNCKGFDGALRINRAETIGADAFSGCTDLYTRYEPQTTEEQLIGQSILKIPSTVTSIGTGAFKSVCSSINDSDKYPKLIVNGISSSENTTAKKNTGVIGKDIFNDAKFRNVEFGGNVNKINEYAFQWYKQLRGSLVFKDNVEEIGNNAFQECGFDGELKLGNVSTIKSSAFHRCYSLYSTVENGKLEIPESMNRIMNFAFGELCSRTPESNWPELVIKGGSVNYGKKLEGPLFNQAHFKNITIGGKITEIAKDAFNNTGNEKPFYNNLKGNLVIEDSVRTIGDNAFKECIGFDGHLTLETVSDKTRGVQKIGESAFEGCTNISYDTSNGGLRDTVQAGKMDTNGLVIPSSVTSIGQNAFRNFSKLSDNPGFLWMHAGSSSNGTVAGSGVFTGSGFRGVYIGDKVSAIAEEAFFTMDYVEEDDAHVKHTDSKDDVFDRGYTRWTGDLYIDGDVKTIGKNAFSNCYGFNGQLVLADGVETIKQNAFIRCSFFSGGLKIPRSVNTIERCAFKSFADRCPDDKVGPLVLLAGTTDNGKVLGTSRSSNFNSWQELENGEHFTAGETSIPVFPYAKFKDVKICGKIEKVSDKFFDNQEGLSTYAKKENGNYVLDANGNYIMTDEHTHDYFKLKGDLIISRNVKEIGTMAFYRSGFDGCLKLNQFITDTGEVLSEDNEEVKANPNAYGTGLTTIGQQAFSDCFDFYSASDISDADRVVTVPETVNSMSSKVFYRFSENAENPAALRILGGSSGTEVTRGVYEQAHFRNVYIGGNVTKISGSAFSSWDDDKNEDGGLYKTLTGNLEFGKSVTEIGEYAFLLAEGFDGTIKFNYTTKKDENDNTVPDKGIGEIGYKAFDSCTNIQSGLHIPCTVYKIGQQAFEKFASRIAPDKAGELLIEGCSGSLKNVTIRDATGEWVKQDEIHCINSNLFNNAKFRDVSVGWMVEYIEDGFMYSRTEKETGYVYDYSGITGDLYIGTNVYYIGTDAFANGGFSGTLRFGQDNSWYKTIGERAFKGQNFTGNLILPHSLYIIEDEAFAGCSGFNGKLVFNERFGHSVASIGESAFSGCTDFYTDFEPEENGEILTSDNRPVFIIPSTVTNMGANAFKSFASSVTDTSKMPAVRIYGYSKTVSENNKTPMLGDNIFEGACFRDVTVGGSVKCISGTAFNDSSNTTGKYSKITGVLEIVPETVGYSSDTNEYFTGSMTGANYWGSFHGCRFSKVLLPRALHDEFISNQYNVFGNYKHDDNGFEYVVNN